MSNLKKESIRPNNPKLSLLLLIEFGFFNNLNNKKIMFNPNPKKNKRDHLEKKTTSFDMHYDRLNKINVILKENEKNVIKPSIESFNINSERPVNQIVEIRDPWDKKPNIPEFKTENIMRNEFQNNNCDDDLFEIENSYDTFSKINYDSETYKQNNIRYISNLDEINLINETSITKDINIDSKNEEDTFSSILYNCKERKTNEIDQKKDIIKNNEETGIQRNGEVFNSDDKGKINDNSGMEDDLEKTMREIEKKKKELETARKKAKKIETVNKKFNKKQKTDKFKIFVNKNKKPNTKVKLYIKNRKEEHVKQKINLEEDLIKFLSIVDNLLEKLPEKVIEEFIQTEDFSLYERVINKYKIR